jgi:hypothetical protein
MRGKPTATDYNLLPMWMNSGMHAGTHFAESEDSAFSRICGFHARTYSAIHCEGLPMWLNSGIRARTHFAGSEDSII